MVFFYLFSIHFQPAKPFTHDLRDYTQIILLSIQIPHLFIKVPASMLFSIAFLAFVLKSPMVQAQRFRVSPQGCLLDQSEKVVTQIKCGRESTVTFAVERYGADNDELRHWLRVAGCSEQEAEAQAQWVVEACQVQSKPLSGAEDDGELRK